MGTTTDKLTYLLETKELIRQAIINKGINVSSSDSFRTYSNRIGQIEGGGAPKWVNTHSIIHPFSDFSEYVNVSNIIIPIENIEEVIIDV